MVQKFDDEARRERARQRTQMWGEVVASNASKPNLYETLSLSERFDRMNLLCQAQWEASGQKVVRLPRSQWPGEIFKIDCE